MALQTLSLPVSTIRTLLELFDWYQRQASQDLVCNDAEHSRTTNDSAATWNMVQRRAMSRSFSASRSTFRNAIEISDDEAAPNGLAYMHITDDENDGDETLDNMESDSGEDDDNIVRELTPNETRAFEHILLQRRQLTRGQKLLDSVRISPQFVIRIDKCYELFTEMPGQYSDFFKVKYLIKDADGSVFARGFLMKRNFNILRGVSKTTHLPLHAILPLPKNELCMELKTTAGKIGSPLNEECLISMPIDRFMRERMVNFTNYPSPRFNYQETGMSVQVDGREHVEEYGVLCCRWKFVEEVDVGKKKVEAFQLLMLDFAECDEGKSMASVPRRTQYGKRSHQSSNAEVINLTSEYNSTSGSKRRAEEIEADSEPEDRSIQAKRRPSDTTQYILQKMATQPKLGARNPLVRTPVPGWPRRRRLTYTLGDACAGGGGVSRAWVMADERLHWVLDKEKVAMKSLRRNFPQVPADNFLRKKIERLEKKLRERPDLVVDVLHFSFPCQGHSWRNRGQNPEQDAKNNALVMALHGVVTQCRPRFVTLEQTNHILTKNEGFYFRKAISQLTSAGYGARWKVCNMLEHGVPQARKRLMILGVCPGERIPNWPEQTHGVGLGLKAPVTIQQAIRDISDTATLHDIAEEQLLHRQKAYRLPVADLNKPLSEIIATQGARVLLPDPTGNYRPTMRQQMRLMTFPDEHVLVGSGTGELTRQIGNAVPCVFMKQIFQEIIKTLEESDAETEAWEPEIIAID